MSTPTALLEIYGTGFETPRGVLHVAAIAGSCAIRIDEHAPRSARDRLVLGAARARADAILTTGRILREEPALTHVLGGDEASDRMLESWRSQDLAKRDRPRSVVLSSGREIPWQHPLLQPRFAPLIATSREGARRIAARAAAIGVEVLAMSEPGPRAVIAQLGDAGLSAITIEAGPSTASALYREPPLVDELWLSRFEGELAPEARGPAFVAREEIERALTRCAEPTRCDEESGPWSFERWQREPR